MESWTTSPLFPLTAAALGALSAFALLAVDVSAEGAAAFGLATFAALLALRNWWVAEEERPLLAEELLGMHDSDDALRDDASDLRNLLTELATVVEDSVAHREAANATGWSEMGAAIDSRLAALESRIAALSAVSNDQGPAERAAAQEALAADMSARLQAAEDRAQNLSKALAVAVREMRRQSDRIEALETTTRQGARAVDPAPSSFGAADDDVRNAALKDPALKDSPVEAPARKSRDAEDRGDDSFFSLDSGLETAAPRGVAFRDVKSEAAVAAPETSSAARLVAAAERLQAGAERVRSEKLDADDAQSPKDAAADCEVLMQAVLALRDGAPRYLEAYSRLVGEGDAIAPRADHVARAKASGVIAQIDILLMARSVAAIKAMEKRGREVGVFCNISLQSLRDDAFLKALLTHLQEAPVIAKRLVFELGQVEVDKASEEDREVLQRVREKGFSFSLDNVVDWSADIAQLARLGFRFVKLDCGALLQRANAAPGAAERLIASFDRVGLELVVEKIETTAQMERIAASGVRLGQGAALAPPRLIRLGESGLPAEPAIA